MRWSTRRPVSNSIQLQAESWKQSAATDILNGIALDYLVNHRLLCGTFGVALGALGLLGTLATGKQVTEYHTEPKSIA